MIIGHIQLGDMLLAIVLMFGSPIAALASIFFGAWKKTGAAVVCSAFGLVGASWLLLVGGGGLDTVVFSATIGVSILGVVIARPFGQKKPETDSSYPFK